jgi:hypothetical protein
MSEDLVSTPGGLHPKSEVHGIPVGNYIDGSTGNIIEHDEKGGVVRDHGPIGKAPSTRDNIVVDNVVVAATPAFPAVFPNGLVTYAEWTNTAATPVNLFLANWIVPHPPTGHAGQVLFLYIGIESGGITLQLALQWGISAAGGGKHWSVAAWFQAPGLKGPVVFFTQLTRVFPGEKLIGAIALKHHSGFLHTYEAQFIGHPKSLLTIIGFSPLNRLYIAFDTYFVANKSDYPSAVETLFTNIVVQAGLLPPAPVWKPFDLITNLGQHTSVVSDAYGDGFVIIFYV